RGHHCVTANRHDAIEVTSPSSMRWTMKTCLQLILTMLKAGWRGASSLLCCSDIHLMTHSASFGDATTNGAGRVSQTLGRVRVKQIDQVLRLPRTAQLAVRPLPPFTLRYACVKLLKIGKFLPRLEHTCLDR